MTKFFTTNAGRAALAVLAACAGAGALAFGYSAGLGDALNALLDDGLGASVSFTVLPALAAFWCVAAGGFLLTAAALGPAMCAPPLGEAPPPAKEAS